MIINTRHGLYVVTSLLWLGACSTVPSPYGGAPVVDRSIPSGLSTARPAPAPTAPLPPVPQAEVKPLTRSEPWQPEPVSPSQTVPDTAYIPPSGAAPPPADIPPEAPPANTLPPADTAPPPSAAPPAPPAPRPPAPPPEISRQGNQAVVALLDSASQYVKSGELDKAAASLERALRIEPRNAGIWHDLAQIRLHQHQYQQAESLATKSNSLAGSNNSLRARNWRLIAVSRRASGNGTGADEAEAQAVVLER